MTTTVTARGQVTIPKSVRDLLGIVPGSQVDFVRASHGRSRPRASRSFPSASHRGARFNPKGVPALYLALTLMTAIKEANQGFAQRLDPCVLCSYEIDCDDIADLTTEEGRVFCDARRDGLRLGYGS